MNIREKARAFAEDAHTNRMVDGEPHVRKYTGEPYIRHTQAVAELVAKAGGDENQQAAAELHDTVEDTEVDIEEIYEVFGADIGGLVAYLTDVYTSEDWPEWNRETRKAYEAARWAFASARAKFIKLRDLEDNTQDIIANDPKFAVTYLAEKAYLLLVLV